jgi:hypothetical protein
MEDSGLVNLVLAIFRYAAQDLRYGNLENKKDVEEFLDSWWFKELCDVFGNEVNLEKVKKMIRENSVSWRDKYE